MHLVNLCARQWRNLLLHNPELRLKARSSQDRGDTLARTTDKGFQNGRIYSLISHNNKMKCELTQMAKVQYVDVKHEEANIAFEGIRFHSAYGYVTVMADRSAQPQNAWCLSMDSWKLRSLGKAPHILTYGLEGLEGLRVGNSDALEVRVGAYYNYVCNAPGFNLRVALSA